MSSKPKKQDYQPSEDERVSAAVALAEYKDFKKKYDPLLQQMRDKSLTDDVSTTLRGRANADTMQALTSNSSYRQTQANDLSSDMSKAYQAQLGQANVQATDVQNKMRSNVLGTARGQAADAQTGMAQASRLGTSEALNRAKAKQQVAEAKFNAAVQVGSAMGQQGLQNLKGGGTFFTPNKNEGLPDAKRELASGWRDRLTVASGRGNI